mmetsp:Transcript_32835/g.75071  ORF Transcript_32835/g.75071 Transcript_32835/m.75071 type:complete len:325 (-) Transcript_32835:606-1580(-)
MVHTMTPTSYPQLQKMNAAMEQDEYYSEMITMPFSNEPLKRPKLILDPAETTEVEPCEREASSSHCSALPYEIQVQFLRLCSDSVFLRAGSVCRDWASIVKSNSEWELRCKKLWPDQVQNAVELASSPSPSSVNWRDVRRARSNILQGAIVSCTGIPSAHRAYLRGMVESMGGKFKDDFNCTVTLLIASRVGTPKYLLSIRKNIPVVKEAWVFSTFANAKAADPTEFQLQPLYGLSISVTGGSTVVRHQIQRLVVANGGEYAAALSPHTSTHLIVMPRATAGSAKLEAAQAWGTVDVVNPRWLLDSITKQACLPVGPYPPRGAC